MYRLKLAILFLTIPFVFLGCSGDSQQNADDGAPATIDAQNTRIAELSGEDSESTDIQPTVSSQTSTATANPDPTSTSLPTSTPEPVPGVVWHKEGFTRVLPVPAIGMAFTYIHESQAIQAISLETGDTLWSIQGKGELLGADKELVYTLPFEQRVDAFDVNTGELRWFSTLPDPAISMLSRGIFGEFPVSNQNFTLITVSRYGGYAFVAVSKSDGQVYAIEGNDAEVEGEIIIVEKGRGYLEPQTPLWDIGDRSSLPRCGGIAFNNIDGETRFVQAFDLNTGNEIWTAQLPGLVVRYAHCSEQDNNESRPQQIFLLTAGQFVSVEARTGEVQYVNAGVTFSYSKAIQQLDEGANIVWGGEVNSLNIFSQPEFGITTARDTLDNTVVWESLDYSLFSIIGRYENNILGVQSVGFPSRQILLSIDALSGELNWTFRPEDEDRSLLYDIRLVNNVVVSIFSSNIYFMDMQTGNILFSDSDVSIFEEFGDKQIVAWDYEKIAVYRLP